QVFAMTKPGSRPLNLGLGATKPVEHYLIYKRQIRHHGAKLYYGFLDTQLTDPPDGGWESLVGNRSAAYYLDPAAAPELDFPNDRWGEWGFRTSARVPMLVERAAVWGRVEKLRRWLADAGVPAREANRFGRADDFALLEADEAEFSHRCQVAVSDH